MQQSVTTYQPTDRRTNRLNTTSSDLVKVFKARETPSGREALGRQAALSVQSDVMKYILIVRFFSVLKGHVVPGFRLLAFKHFSSFL